MTSPAKVLYLDYDGVLHDEDVWRSPKRGIYVGTPGRVLFEWTSILEALLEPYPEVRIVLSTSWVRVFSFNFARKQLTPSLQNRVIGATFHRREMRKDWFALLPRGVQVLEDVERRRPARWFAIDDDPFGWPSYAINRVVVTEGRRGLSDASAQEAVKSMLEAISKG